jgi:predicted branched-subunit amino acid permease
MPVLLGYIAIGVAFGLLLAGAGYPWWLALVMSLVMYAGAGQYAAVGLFAAGAGLWEALAVQLVVNARHLAYGLPMRRRFSAAGPLKYYLIFALTDETFALLSSLDGDEGPDRASPDTVRSDTVRSDSVRPDSVRSDSVRFMFYVALLDHSYWTAGSVIGAVAGSLLPFSMGGVGFALTALFIVLMIEQILRARKARIFVIAATAAILAAVFLPGRFSLLSALALSLVLIPLTAKRRPAGVKP